MPRVAVALSCSQADFAELGLLRATISPPRRSHFLINTIFGQVFLTKSHIFC